MYQFFVCILFLFLLVNKIEIQYISIYFNYSIYYFEFNELLRVLYVYQKQGKFVYLGSFLYKIKINKEINRLLEKGILVCVFMLYIFCVYICN